MKHSEETKFRDAIAHFALDYAKDHKHTELDAAIALGRAMRLVCELIQFRRKGWADLDA